MSNVQNPQDMGFQPHDRTGGARVMLLTVDSSPTLWQSNHNEL